MCWSFLLRSPEKISSCSCKGKVSVTIRFSSPCSHHSGCFFRVHTSTSTLKHLTFTCLPNSILGFNTAYPGQGQHSQAPIHLRQGIKVKGKHVFQFSFGYSDRRIYPCSLSPVLTGALPFVLVIFFLLKATTSLFVSVL